MPENEANRAPLTHPGTLLTFLQFLFIALIGYTSHFDLSSGPSRLFLKPNRVPLKRWLVNIALFFTINVLNNHAFSYNISVPIHIILRSGGSITTIAVGYLWGKRFSRTQITSVLLLTVGVITAAWSDQQNKSAEQDAGKQPPAGEAQRPSFSYGLAVLFFAQVLSAVMGIYTEETYRQYGPQWKENLFYSHFVALPLFIPFIPSMARQFGRMAGSEPLQLPWSHLGQLEGEHEHWGENGGWEGIAKSTLGVRIPSQLFYMALNVLTQYACIRGVNLLASTSSALTVTIVLNVRKLVSLLLSIWLFGNKLSPGTIIGAGIVFTSGGMYSLDRTKPKARRGRPRAQTGTQLKEMKELNGEGKVG